MSQAQSLEGVKNLISRLPLGLIFALFIGYLSYDYYHFTSEPDSPLLQKQAQVDLIKKENVQILGKIKQAHEFYKGLEQKKIQLRSLAQDLDELKNVLTGDLDIPNFVRQVVTEAKRVGISVVSIRPTESKASEYYVEQAFDLSFKGFYIQLLVFLDRLSNLERIIRVDNFDLKRNGSSLAQYVELEGVLQIKTYRYLGSKADDIARSNAASTGGQPSGSAQPVSTPSQSQNIPAQPTAATRPQGGQ